MKPENSLPPRKSVLVVEDDAQWAEIVCAILKLQGWHPRSVDSLGAARAALTGYPVEWLLLDLRLPDANVEASLEEIPRLKSLGASRVAIITGCDVTDSLRRLAETCKADAVVSKDVRCFERELALALREKS